MNVFLEKNRCLVKDNDLKSRLGIMEMGYKKELKLYLDLFESVYLLEKQKIKVVDEKKNVSLEKLIEIAKKEIENFENKYLVFKEYTDTGYSVKDGLIFGFDFRVYKRSKKHTHTVYVVDVKETHATSNNKKNKESLVSLVKSERLANTINAKYIIAIIDLEKKINKIKIERI